jgi:competence protein ComGC
MLEPVLLLLLIMLLLTMLLLLIACVCPQVYIEMDADEKKQGKAAVDLVGSQVGGAFNAREIGRDASSVASRDCKWQGKAAVDLVGSQVSGACNARK